MAVSVVCPSELVLSARIFIANYAVLASIQNASRMKVASNIARPVPRNVKPAIERLEALLATQGESALLRFSLGNACLDTSPARAIEHLRRAVALDAEYSAAWKLLGRALVAQGAHAQAQIAFAQGIEVAERRGDIQAAKEMRVFLKRLRKE